MLREFWIWMMFTLVELYSLLTLQGVIFRFSSWLKPYWVRLMVCPFLKTLELDLSGRIETLVFSSKVLGELVSVKFYLIFWRFLRGTLGVKIWFEDGAVDSLMLKVAYSIRSGSVFKNYGSSVEGPRLLFLFLNEFILKARCFITIFAGVLHFLSD